MMNKHSPMNSMGAEKASKLGSYVGSSIAWHHVEILLRYLVDL